MKTYTTPTLALLSVSPQDPLCVTCDLKMAVNDPILLSDGTATGLVIVDIKVDEIVPSDS